MKFCWRVVRSTWRAKSRKMQSRVRQCSVVLALLLLLYSLSYSRASRSSDPRVRCIRSVPRSFTKVQQVELCAAIRTDTSSHVDPTLPGQCANMAMGGRSLKSTKFASRVELLRAAAIVKLCANAQHIGPAKCWLVIPTQLRQQMLAASVSLDADIDDFPLLRVCQHAPTEVPGKCLLMWLSMSSLMKKQEVQDTVLDICEQFGGQVAALKQCVKLATPYLRGESNADVEILQLCRFVGDGSNLKAIVDCTSTLGKKRVSPWIIGRLCAGVVSGSADIINTQPQVCFIQAQSKLRWMDVNAQIILCSDAIAESAVAPIKCALEVKHRVQTTFSISNGTTLNNFVANLCYRAISADAVVDCVRSLPMKAFSPDQALRLCAATTMPAEQSGNISIHSTCASKARALLQRAMSLNSDSGLSISASSAAVRVCEHTTSDAPSKCLEDTQFDKSLPVALRVDLCQRATSNAPQQCLRSLRKFINGQRLEISAAVAVCSQTESLGPVECLTELFQESRLVNGAIASQLCRAAKDLEPARCFLASLRSFNDALKVSLCHQAESAAPASCATTTVSRLGNDPLQMVALCRGARSAAPAACAVEAPFGMDEKSLVLLCQNAASIEPAKCAHAVSSSLRVPWLKVAQVCVGASSTVPGRCLDRQIRQSRLKLHAFDDKKTVKECRMAIARPSSLKIAESSYNCPELRPTCPLQLVINVLDQYGEFVLSSEDTVHVRVKFTHEEDHRRESFRRWEPRLVGPSYAVIANGTAVFSNLQFSAAGEYTLTFRAGGGVTEEVVRVLVHPDLAQEALERRCESLFSRFQCSSHNDQHYSELILSRVFHLSAVTCQQYWLDNIGGLTYRGFTAPNDSLYTLSRPLYDLFTNSNVPHPDMTAYELLGLSEGETSRTAIRRAYHRKSLEWHPDKWHSVAAALPPVWQYELGSIYSLVTQAYDRLLHP